MEAMTSRPRYTVYAVVGSEKYNLTPAMESLDLTESDRSISMYATVTLRNQAIGKSWLSSILKVRSRVFIYADDGKTKAEVFRGYIWDRAYKSSMDDRTIQIKCFDNLIYLQESDHSVFFASGKSTKDACKAICDDWGISLDYAYESITHSKLALRGSLSDIFISDLLDPVKDRTGKKYAIISVKDAMRIVTVGSNTTIYKFVSGQNAISTQSICTMDGMTTKVIILGKANDDDRQPVEATVSGNTAAYGTLQKTISRSENTSLADAKKEAQSIIDEDGKPYWEYELKAPDIPWIRKGDKVQVSAGDMVGYFIVKEVDRSISNTKSEMTLTLENP